MDLSYPPAAEELRKEVRDWIERNLPSDWRDRDRIVLGPKARKQFEVDWTRKLKEGGWICATWPKEYGGRGLDLMEGVVLYEEFARARVPMRADLLGDTLVGPTILRWGTDEQKHYFLPKILRGDIRWCQGFSEPDAGSDLASVRTTGELDGDEWVITGTKVWTSQAQYADFCFLLARTDSDAERHEGLSFLLLSMRQPGIEVLPLAQIDGSREFNQVSFDRARAPAGWVVGGINNGWKVAMTTLGFERGMSATTGHLRFRKELEEIGRSAAETGRSLDPVIRQRLARAWTQIRIMEINGLRILSDMLNGTRQGSALSSLNKLSWSEAHQTTTNLAMDILGPGAQVLSGPPEEELIPGVGWRPQRPGYPVSKLQGSFLFARSETIWGGSSQIQRNIIAERVLGLPREPRP